MPETRDENDYCPDRPCPSFTIAHLGFQGLLSGARVPCGLLAGHYPDTKHVFHVEWTDPSSPAPGLGQRMAAANKPLRRPR